MSEESGNITLCDSSVETGAMTACRVAATGLNRPNGFYINGKYAYVTSRTDNMVYRCNITSVGNLISCTPTGGPYSVPVSVDMVNNRFAYIANAGAGFISRCNINSLDGSLSQCTNVLGNGVLMSLSQPSDVVINGNYAYIADYNSYTIVLCNVNSTTGAFYNCLSNTGSGYNGPSDVQIDSNSGYAYVTNFEGQSVSVCTFNSRNGSFTNCFNVPIPADLGEFPECLITLPNNKAYVAQYFAGVGAGFSIGNSITLCNVNTSTGALFGCSQTGVGSFKAPVTLWYVYVTNAPTRAPT